MTHLRRVAICSPLRTPVGKFLGIGKAVPVVVGIGVVLYAVAVQVLHYVCDVDDEGLCQRGVVLVGCLYADV